MKHSTEGVIWGSVIPLKLLEVCCLVCYVTLKIAHTGQMLHGSPGLLIPAACWVPDFYIFGFLYVPVSLSHATRHGVNQVQYHHLDQIEL